MKNKLSLTERWQPFLASLMIKFIELNKGAIGDQKSSILIKFSKGQTLEKIASDEKISTTRVRQLIDSASRELEQKVNQAKIEELKTLRELCKSLEAENVLLRTTLAVNKVDEVTPLSKLNLSVRAIRVLEKLNVSSVEQLCKIEIEDILKVKNAGTKTISEIEDAMANYGLTLGSE